MSEGMSRLDEIMGKLEARKDGADEPAPFEPSCHTCRDIGYVDDDSGRAVMCDCRNPAKNRRVLIEALRSAGMEADEIASAVRVWDESAQAKPTELWEWCRAIATGQEVEVRSWVLVGKNGRGKTLAATKAIAAYIMAGGRRALWINAVEATEKVMAERRMDYRVGDLFEDRIKNCPFLVIDELGGEKEGNRSEAIDSWILWRYRRQLPMVGTTNADVLGNLSDGRVASRLGQGKRLRMTGPDMRAKK